MRSYFTKLFALCVAAVVSAGALYAQTRITGTVYDEEGEPIVGVSVYVLGTNNKYAQTDRSGNWAIVVDDPETAVVEFSCLGYKTVAVHVGVKGVINVVMNESYEQLDEIVHVGYGTQKKVNLTGSVSAVNMAEISDTRTIINTSTALAGLVPGMNVMQSSGRPIDDGADILIRGVGTFTEGASGPLVLVDGVEFDMDDVNPNDIESISVLKDAASTAIYGSRAANGVILITTKMGVESKPRISYSFKGIWQTQTDRYKLVSNSANYMELINEAYENSGLSAAYSQSLIDTFRDAEKKQNEISSNGLPNYMVYPNIDWWDEIFDTAFSQEHQISVSGGSKNVRYMLSGSFLDNTGIVTKYGFDTGTKRTSVRANVEADVTKWLTVGAKIYGEYYVNRGDNFNWGISSKISSTVPYLYPGTNDAWGRDNLTPDAHASNIWYETTGAYEGKTDRYKVNGTIYGNIRLYKGLTLEGSANYSPTFTYYHQYSTPNGRFDYVNNAVYSTSSLDNAFAADCYTRDYSTTTQVLLRYNTTIKRLHELGVLLGYSTEYYKWRYSELGVYGATDWTLHDTAAFSGDTIWAEGDPSTSWALRSYFARVNYAFKDRYLFEANFRADGSSKFGKNHRYGFFPSVSAGWKIHEEPWMASAKDWLSELKIRASWGETGNNSGIGNFDAQSTYTSGSVVVDGSTSSALYIDSMSNVDLRWETTSTTDVGVDAGFFKNRLTLVLDYYYKMTRDILYTPETYNTMGTFSAVPENLGKMWNQGVEMALNWKDSVGDGFYYYVGVNASFNKNKVVKFKGLLSEGYDEDGNYWSNETDISTSYKGGVLVKGHQIGEHRIYQTYSGSGAGYTGGTVDPTAGPKDGMIRTEQDMDWVRAMIDQGYSFYGTKTISKDQLWYGDLIMADVNGDGNYGNSYDRIWSGHTSIPTVNLGISLGFAWKGLEFSMLWAGAFDYYLIWNTSWNSTALTAGKSISLDIGNDHYFYDPENPSDSRTNINGKYPRLTKDSTLGNALTDTYHEYKGDYMKLKNLTIAYTLPRKWTQKFFANQLKFFVTGENLLTITSFPGMDPEMGADPGYPIMRQYTIGAQITF